jgi:hypothetical protein
MDAQRTEAESQDASPQATGHDEALSREAAAGLGRIVDEHGQASTTVRQLLSQFGHDALTEDAMDDVFEALRAAGLREDPMLSKEGLTLDSPIKVRRVEKHKEKEERSFITWGFVGAVLFAPVGIFFGIRLLVRERLGPGIAVILVAVAVWGAGIVIVLGQAGAGPAAERFNAHDTTLQKEVETAIEAKGANGGVTVSGVSCVAQSASGLTCLGSVTSGYGSGQATYAVTIDTNTGHYIIAAPQVSLNGG